MSRKKRLFKVGQRLELNITDMAFGGKGIARVDTDEGEFTVFVQNSIPGQKVIAKVAKSKKRHAECKLVDVLERSPLEVSRKFQAIPGAPYATLPLKEQTKLKKQTSFELFKRIGHVEDIESKFDEYIESPEEWHYRNKMEYSFSVIRHDLEDGQEYDDFGLGFKHRGTWWCVENLDKDSGLFDEEFENKLNIFRKWCEDSGLPAWHPPQRKGFFRFFVVRKSYFSNKLLVNLVTSADHLDEFDLKGYIQMMKDLFGERIAGVLHTINDSVGDRSEPENGKVSLLYGEPKIIEMINGLEFEISMGSFFQTNPKCAEKLYSKVIDYAGENSEKDMVILDLFCGTGTITQLLAQGTKQKVVGVDIVEAAIEDAKLNARRNRISQVEFHAADAGKFLLKYPHYKDKISTIVLDPPRAGIAPKTLLKVISLNAKRIVYVSCNPATQARDAETLLENGYSFRKFTLVDQFPHTSHVESIAVFEKD